MGSPNGIGCTLRFGNSAVKKSAFTATKAISWTIILGRVHLNLNRLRSSSGFAADCGRGCVSANADASRG